MKWTTEQVIALAPDSSSVKAAKKLLSLSKWSNMGQSERALWGECKGSGKKPYLTRIDLEEPAFKCSCPSRKFPCKHGLALFLLRLEQEKSFKISAPPAWVTEWLEDRGKRAETKTKRAETKAKKEADPVAAAKRAEKRETNIQAGVEELELWLHDLMRQGLASLESKPYGFWDEMASRMVDAQAPGLANRLRTLGSLSARGNRYNKQDKTEVVLEQLGLLHLLIEGYKRLDDLTPDLQADVKSLLGWAQDQNTLLKQDSIMDTWQVLGQVTSSENNLTAQRTWLYGETSGCMALVLNFAFGGKAIESGLHVNSVFNGELVFYAGHAPQRALVKEKQEHQALGYFEAQLDILAATESYAQALSCQPWLERYPMLLSQVMPVPKDEQWLIVDSKHQLKVHPNFNRGWELLALSGGRPLTLFGEWDGKHYLPLSASLDGETLRLHS